MRVFLARPHVKMKQHCRGHRDVTKYVEPCSLSGVYIAVHTRPAGTDDSRPHIMERVGVGNQFCLVRLENFCPFILFKSNKHKMLAWLNSCCLVSKQVTTMIMNLQ